MTRIRLFVTGKTEEVLDRAFTDLFPMGSFETATDLVGAGFTGSRLNGARPTQRAQEALGILVGAVQRNGGADYAILVDDLELQNVGNATGVTEYFRNAASALARTCSESTVNRLRRRVSVHVVAPMIEAYFFADRAALTAGGLAPSISPIVGPGAPEEFYTTDPAFLAPAAENPQALETRKRTVEQWRSAMRCVHPKHYLMYLLERSGCHYAEVDQGRAALRALDLRTAWSLRGSRWGLLGALVDDVADMLDVPSPTPVRATGATSGPGQFLRNL